MLRITSLIILLSLTGPAFSFEYRHQVRHGLALKLEATSPLTTESQTLNICSEDNQFRIQTARIRPLTSRSYSEKRLSVAMTKKGCFRIGNLAFNVAGAWELAVWDQDGQRIDVPLVVASNSYTLFNDLGQPAVQAWVSNQNKKRQIESWLFCGKKLVNHVYFYHPETKTRLFKRELQDFGESCRIFSKLPLPHKGQWQLITVLDNGEKLAGRVVYH